MSSSWPSRCPGCGNVDRIPVVWGMPGPDDFARAEAGEFALGGCCVPADFGRVGYWACRACGHQFPVRPLSNDSPVGRLLEEISWDPGSAVCRQTGLYRCWSGPGFGGARGEGVCPRLRRAVLRSSSQVSAGLAS